MLAVKHSNIDGLTACLNRNGLEKNIRQIFENDKIKIEYAVLMIDIDHFKNVNDSMGHKIGDDVIRGVAKITSSILRKTDRLARWGGEEFVAICKARNADVARTIAERIRVAVESHAFYDNQGGEFHVCVSEGFAMVGQKDSFEDVFKKADEALYEAKRGGRNKVCIHSSNPLKLVKA